MITKDYLAKRIGQFRRTAAATVTLQGCLQHYVLTGTTCVVTVPDVALGDQLDFYVHNQGSGIATINGTMYGSAAISTFALPAGSSALLFSDGTKWKLNVISSSSGGGGATLPSYDLTTGLLLHWKMSEGNTVSLPDSSGNSRSGIVTGAAMTYQLQGIYAHNLALHLGLATRVDSSSSIGSPTSMSFAMWLKFEVKGTTGSYGVSLGSAIGLRFEVGSLGMAELIVEENTAGNWIGTQMIGMSPLSKGWHHWAAVFDATYDRKAVYLDGNCLISQPTAAAIYWGGGSIVTIGGHPGSPDYNYAGLLQDLRVWSVPLSPIQILQLAGRQPGATP